MSSQPQSEKLSPPRLMLGVGFFLIFVAVGIGASTSGGSEIPKYLAGAAVVAIVGGAIWGALQGRLRRGK